MTIDPATKEILTNLIANGLDFVLGSPLHLGESICLIGLIVGAFVLWLSAKWLRFRNPSFWTSLCCMTIAIGSSGVGLLAMPRIPFFATIAAGLGFVAIAGVISITWLFREPLGKSLAAIELVLLSEALWLGVCYVIFGILLAYGLRHLDIL